MGSEDQHLIHSQVGKDVGCIGQMAQFAVLLVFCAPHQEPRLGSLSVLIFLPASFLPSFSLTNNGDHLVDSEPANHAAANP